MKLPIKTRILEYAIEYNKPFTAKELSAILQKEYPGEKTCNVKNIAKQLDTYCGIGVMNAVEVSFDENNPDNLIVTFAVTEAGKYYQKYIPKQHK